MTEDFVTMLDKLRHRHYGNLSFHAVCPNCLEPVETDDSIDIGKDGYIKQPNATCSKCGRVEMPFDGIIIKHFGDNE